MNIELRDIKYAAFASRETACFEAAVYIDSKREGTVTNDGHGGCNDYHPRELGQRIEAYASDKTEDNVDADMVIGNALDAALARRDLQRLLRTHIITMRGGRIYQTRAGRKDMLAELVERLRTQPHEQVLQRFGAEHVLNVMPFDEALVRANVVEQRHGKDDAKKLKRQCRLKAGADCAADLYATKCHGGS